MIGIQFRGPLVDGLAFNREFLEGPACSARVAATGRRRLGHKQLGKHRESGDSTDCHKPFHFRSPNELAAKSFNIFGVSRRRTGAAGRVASWTSTSRRNA